MSMRSTDNNLGSLEFWSYAWRIIFPTTEQQIDQGSRKETNKELPLTRLPPGPLLVAAGADAGVEYIAEGDVDDAGALVVALYSGTVSAIHDHDLGSTT